MNEFLGVISVAIAAYAYYAYLRDIARGTTKPHAFTWLVWGTLTGIGFLAQLAEGAGPGAWATGFTAAVCLVIVAAGLRAGNRDITRTDGLFLTAALISIVPWALTSNPVWSVVLITVIDLLGYGPTVRKSWNAPWSETMSTHALSGLKFVFGVAALDSVSLTTALYPSALVLANFTFVAMLVMRRRSVMQPQPGTPKGERMNEPSAPRTEAM